MEKIINDSPATIKQSIEAFKTYLLENDKSLNTIKSYSQDINHFHTWIKTQSESPYLISTLTSTDLKEYADHLKSDPSFSPATVNRRLVSLISWSQFLINIGSTSINISKDVRLKKIQKQNDIRWLTRKEVGKLLHTIELTKQQSFTKGMLHQTIVHLAVNLGLRVQEMCNVKISDIDFGRNIINLKGKGDKHRIVPLTNNTKLTITNWLEKRTKASEYLLVSSKSNRMSSRAIQHIFKNYSDQLGILVTPHSLRHTYCKQLAEQGINIQSIAELAGHSSIETTRIYVTPSIQELHNALERTEF